MRIEIPKRDPKEALTDFKEVNLGYSLNDAVAEALRCNGCKEPGCVEACPIRVNIPGFIKCIKDKDIKKAVDTIKESNPFPSICSRVCPQERLCEGNCILSNKGKAIAIGNLERFAADNEDNIFIMPQKIPKTNNKKKTNKKNKKIAIVGSGPAGLTCANDLLIKGYEVVIFEALHCAGGVLRYGIPEFRLPKKIVDHEIEKIKKLGAEIKINHVIGKTIIVDDLQKDYDAVFIGTGAGLPNLPQIPGEHLNRVFTANEYLTRINLMNAYHPMSDTPIKKTQKVVVIGGGNTALDCARVAKRLGSQVTLVYRRSFNEMTGRKEDFENARTEGINFFFLTSPTKILGKKAVDGIELIQMMVETDHEGRKKPVPIENTEFIMDCDKVIFAIGQGPNPLITNTTKIAHRIDKSIVVDGKLRTSKRRVFAGGDVVGGDTTVIKAMVDGRRAADYIDEIFNEE